jgi:PAS domain S-box-containing protein
MSEILTEFSDAPNTGSIVGEPTGEPDPVGGDASSPNHPSCIRTRTLSTNARFWLAAIADSSDDAIVGKDLNGIVTSWNKAAESMFGYTSEEIVGRSITCIIPPDRINEEASILARVRRNEKIVHFETERMRKDGGILPISITVSPIRDDRNRIIGVSKIARDLTDRDRREAELRAANAELELSARHLAKERDRAKQANRAKSRFLAGMSHELRTPLNGILGYAQLLQMEGGLTTTQRTRVEAMLTTGKHLLEMITCVLDLSEIESERVELRPTECDVVEIASACLDLLRPEATAKGLTLSIAVSPATQRRLATDPVRLRQILFNLLGNAVKFTSQGAIEIRLRTASGRRALRIEITDTGPGVPAAQQHRLFQEFERLEPSGAIEGAGLGLALSARFAVLIGGRLGYDDNPEGGSVFWLELPLDTVTGSSAASASSPAPPDVETARPLESACHVLVVDDVPMNRDIAAALLGAAGHKVTSVEGGEQAIAAVSESDVGVVLMDIRMPGMDGLEATRRIRTLDGDRGRVPIIALTAHAFAEQIEECRKAGMNGHVSKPYDQATLIAAIAAARSACAQNGKLGTRPLSASSALGAEIPVFDPGALDRVACYLPSTVVAANLQTIANDAKALLGKLENGNGPVDLRDALSEATHALASSAGMFGFQRLAVLCRRFERAMQSEAPDLSSLGDALRVAIAATLLAHDDHAASTSEP